MQKAWVKPQLVVLARNQPEEAVLLACKVWNGSSGPNYYDARCNHPVSCGLGCSSQLGT
jgi:hypothetical protein